MILCGDSCFIRVWQAPSFRFFFLREFLDPPYSDWLWRRARILPSESYTHAVVVGVTWDPYLGFSGIGGVGGLERITFRLAYCVPCRIFSHSARFLVYTLCGVLTRHPVKQAGACGKLSRFGSCCVAVVFLSGQTEETRRVAPSLGGFCLFALRSQTVQAAGLRACLPPWVASNYRLSWQRSSSLGLRLPSFAIPSI